MTHLHAVRLAFGLSFLVAQAAYADSDRPITSSPFDPQAKAVELFAGIEAGVVTAKLVARGSAGGNLFLTNHTQEPLTVQMPDAFVGVPVHAQFGASNIPSPFGQMQGMGNAGAGNRPQPVGAGTGSTGTGSGQNGIGNNGPGIFGNNAQQGFFSIPANRTLRVPYTSVCLQHGMQDPTPRVTFQLMPVEIYTTDPVLQALIHQVGDKETPQRTLQAAVWNIANGLTWQELAEKGTSPVRIPGDNYFSSSQIKNARQLVSDVQGTIRESNSLESPTNSPRVARAAR
ncbi:hypothetical protein [Planctomicrobium piriforme]|uniref:Uncharacterized protein n=1 Tax=Planctomicrobium piriforme TaxID=1576369 RepID=A0A1I3EJR5_9PLAN|nr:hypothetical protein [Planctomicrobium piriforme]SFH99224.1 hypothetical protein SAMN05421753_104255 [Planctomicrobium piriforme]